ncbi:MAG: dCTP deaminase domain-containing protein, partial [Pseudonocardiaceae bacterium]
MPGTSSTNEQAQLPAGRWPPPNALRSEHRWRPPGSRRPAAGCARDPSDRGPSRHRGVSRSGATPWGLITVQRTVRCGGLMILTGPEIARAVRRGEIVIEPFMKENLEPNSYRVALGDGLLVSTAVDLDAREVPQMRRDIIPASGYILEPCELYLGETAEILGAHSFATTLHATRSAASLG